MTIDRRLLAAPAGALALTLIVWFGGLAALTVVVEPKMVVAFGTKSALWRAVGAADASLVGAGRGYLTLAGTRPGYVRALYAGGAWFVWPITARTCGKV
jgi:hypothetical protein